MKRKYIDLLFIALAAGILFIPFLGGVHLFDWDEINFAESAREMLQTHDFLTVQINYHAFWEKPPLFIWMQVLSMKLFGVNEFAARFPDAMAGVVTLIILYLIGEKLFSRRFGLIWVLVYAGSILPQLYFRSGIIDPWFNLFIFLGIYFMALYLESRKNRKNRKEYLYIFLSVAPHRLFRRDGANIHCRVPITMTTAALGGRIEVPMVNGGRTRVKILEGTQTGRQFRLKGKGMPVMRSKAVGDMYIQVEVETPGNLTRKQKDILKEFDKASSDSTSPDSSSFFARVKEFFDGMGE